MSGLIPGFATRRTLVVVGVAPDLIQVPIQPLVLRGPKVIGSRTGTTPDNEDYIVFSRSNEVRP